MARILARIGRALRLDAHDAPVHFHTGHFWHEVQPEICDDPACTRARVRLD